MLEKSQELFERAQKIIPGGVNSPARAFKSVGGTPPFIKKAVGALLFDEDGNEYIDFVGSWGPMILGHAYKPVIEAVKAAAESFHFIRCPNRHRSRTCRIDTFDGPRSR